MNHETTIETYKNHRPGVDYYRARCSCGWCTVSITRNRANAEAMAAVHIRRLNEG